MSQQSSAFLMEPLEQRRHEWTCEHGHTNRSYFLPGQLRFLAICAAPGCGARQWAKRAGSERLTNIAHVFDREQRERMHTHDNGATSGPARANPASPSSVSKGDATTVGASSTGAGAPLIDESALAHINNARQLLRAMRETYDELTTSGCGTIWSAPLSEANHERLADIGRQRDAIERRLDAAAALVEAAEKRRTIVGAGDHLLGRPVVEVDDDTPVIELAPLGVIPLSDEDIAELLGSGYRL